MNTPKASKTAIIASILFVLFSFHGKVMAQSNGMMDSMFENESSNQAFKTNESVFIGGTVIVKWSAVITDADYSYQIERSKDGRDYSKIGEKAGMTSIGDYETFYSFIDTAPFEGYSYYRVSCFSGSELAVQTEAMKVFNNYSIELAEEKSIGSVQDAANAEIAVK